jgi:hypothetical protein
MKVTILQGFELSTVRTNSPYSNAAQTPCMDTLQLTYLPISVKTITVGDGARTKGILFLLEGLSDH